MISVLSGRHPMQGSVLAALGLGCVLLVGCTYRFEEQPPSTTTPGRAGAAEDLGSSASQSGEASEQPAAETQEAPGSGEGARVEPQEPPAAEPAAGDAEQTASETEESPGEGAASGKRPTGRAAVEKTAEKNPFDPTEVPTVVWLPEPIEVPDAVAKAEAKMKPYTERIPGSDVTFDMVPIEGGQFMMGSPENEAGRKDDEGPQHEVIVEPFWMGRCEVTWDEYELWGLGLDQQFRQLKGQQPTERDTLVDAITRPTKPYTDMTFGMGSQGYPAICMTQLAARMYCKWLSAKTGRYYRLPTEAEWEYACRAGTTSAYSFGDDPDQLDQYAWYFDNCEDQYHKVGQKKPNPWGLHDMHGNVSEWVLDQYIPDYYKQLGGKTTRRPLAVPTKVYPRTIRGGCWDDDPEQLRSAARGFSSRDWNLQDPQIPQSIWYHTEIYCPGFRVVRPLRVPDVEEAKLYEPDVQAVREYQEAQGGKM